MDSRKKELKAMYREMPPDMGVFLIRCGETGDGWLGWANNIHGKLNSIRFRLESGSFHVRALQEQWKQYGAGSFTMETLERLEPDKDGRRDDYSGDLEALRDMCLEGLEGVEKL